MIRARFHTLNEQTVKDWAANGLAPHSPTVARKVADGLGLKLEAGR